MADIELVIKIPEEVYKNLQKRSTEIQAEGYLLENLVLNGTLLPKEHGKIDGADTKEEREESIMGMIGFKAFDKDLKCRDFQYEIGHTYEFDGEPIPCKQGFHFCKSIAETYDYYTGSENTRICKIEAIGEISTYDDTKYCTNKIKIIEEITEDWIRKGNANSLSSGYRNTGYYNTGSRNTGDRNTGGYNTGDCNTGYRNTGNCNTGDRNTGDYNTGYYNTGDRNTGDYNTGDYNTGDYNTGDWNTGDYNTGDWNSTNNSSGCFNTEKGYIFMFNRLTRWTIDQWRASDAHHILNRIPKIATEYVYKNCMSDEEKEMYPTYKTIGGYLKVSDKKNAAQEYWDGLTEREKQTIYELPNFDKDVFKQCTGIEV